VSSCTLTRFPTLITFAGFPRLPMRPVVRILTVSPTSKIPLVFGFGPGGGFGTSVDSASLSSSWSSLFLNSLMDLFTRALMSANSLNLFRNAMTSVLSSLMCSGSRLWTMCFKQRCKLKSLV